MVMKKLLILILLISACGKNNGAQCISGGTVQNNDQTQTQVNGVCTMETKVNWQNSNYSEDLICGLTIVTKNNMVCQMTVDQITPSTTTCPAQSDDYYVTPSADSKSQCWYEITNGQINTNASAPNF
jgi:hypothetical protein